ncbi:hypothetical protein B0H11DRAFT_2334737 [Mycena galericulata]|nr:hypothetical protein B0H11DRAFT_2334737 [Mycena galericulata]
MSGANPPPPSVRRAGIWVEEHVAPIEPMLLAARNACKFDGGGACATLILRKSTTGPRVLVLRAEFEDRISGPGSTSWRGEGPGAVILRDRGRLPRGGDDDVKVPCSLLNFGNRNPRSSRLVPGGELGRRNVAARPKLIPRLALETAPEFCGVMAADCAEAPRHTPSYADGSAGGPNLKQRSQCQGFHRRRERLQHPVPVPPTPL